MRLSFPIKQSSKLFLLFLCFGIPFFFVSCGTNPTKDKSSSGAKSKNGKVLAKVGSYEITSSEFLRRYAMLKKEKPSPKVFLQQLIDEALLLLKSRELKFSKKALIETVYRKSLAQATLKHGFHKWFNPKNLDSMLVRKFYSDFSYKYTKPTLAKAYHLLVRVREPKKEDGEVLSAAELSKQSLERIKKAKKLASEFLVKIKAEDPQTKEAFEKFTVPFKKQYNKPEPFLLKLHASLKNSWKEFGSKEPRKMLPLLMKTFQDLEKRPFCTQCMIVKKSIDKWIDKLRDRNQPLPSAKEKKLLDSWKYLTSLTIKVKMEKLPGFPEKGVMGFPAMVKRFAKGTYRLKDNTFSKKPVLTSFGFHIIFRYGTVEGFNKTFEEVEGDIRENLYQKMRPLRFRQWFMLRGKKYSVKRFYGPLKKTGKK